MEKKSVEKNTPSRRVIKSGGLTEQLSQSEGHDTVTTNSSLDIATTKNK